MSAQLLNAMQAAVSALAGGADEDPAKASQPVVLFNASKKELHHPGAGYKRFYRRLRSNFGCKTQVNKESGPITLARLQEAQLVVFGAPSTAFAEAERDAIHAYVKRGGSVLFCTGEGGDGRGGELNDVLRPFGVATADNCVVRAAYYKYHHPKEVFVADGVGELAGSESELDSTQTSSTQVQSCLGLRQETRR